MTRQHIKNPTFCLPIILIVSLLILLNAGCSKEPEVIGEGSTDDVGGHIIDDEGNVLRTDPEGEFDPIRDHNPDFAPLFPGAQRVHPAGEDPSLREAYVTRAPFDAVVQFYEIWLGSGITLEPGEAPDEIEAVNPVNVLESVDGDKRQTGLFVNEGIKDRGGLKVMLKEFPGQNMVQIILTTVDATPPGLNPVGMWVSQEEIDEIAEEIEQEEQEYEERREEVESQVANPEDDVEEDEAEEGE